ncbi:S8 family serine peptidase [Marinicella sp. S1101]|uniref:S8 family serine peptidase n=1 Tax=Marinicella marina TaxID=2996016 RepID=UPI00226090E0|nr:S8 family serine peptidase [Marinicella marina]MCX7552608.1 S8 family serine peptidase [Marinicella marina]
MSKSKFNPLITASVMSAVYLAGVSFDSQAVVDSQLKSDDATSLTASFNDVTNYRLPAANAQGQKRYIVQFKQPSVAMYNGAGSFAPIPRLANHKIDTKSPAVRAYVNALDTQQTNFLSGLSSNFGRSVDALFSYKFAVNGVALYLTPEEASQVSNMTDVKHIELDREHYLDTDAGPTLIGANNVWDGAAPSTGTAFGEGVVLGIIDSGANFDHPSFADIGGDGYDHTNPLGAGNYLGVCDPTNVDQFNADYTCNDKLIGGYDFVDNAAPEDAFEVPGPEDENGHGTHTASTAGGNLVLTASANGVENIEISGVARHANVIAYDACYTSAQGQGLCPNVSTLASIDQVIADGIVDVVNYSIGGGTSPWTEAVSQSFLAATDNGVFVSASAGNSGPGPATLGHVEPWTATVGASTHTRGFETLLSMTGPGTPGAEVTDIAYITSNGPAFGAPITGGVQYSEVVDPANLEACVPFPANSFDGLVALVSRGTCSFEDKVNNSSDAGAIAVIVHNDDRAVAFGMNVGTTTTIPSVSIPQADGFALRDFILANPAPAAQIEIVNPAIVNTEQADVMADFSSRGPSPFEVNKPDVTGPGVNILAAFNDNEFIPTNADEEYGIISGTSMSSPHNAGAAALLKELQPNWSAPEIKSALMMTAVTAGVTKEDATTPADAFDRGAGRIQVDLASSSGLVMDESAFDFLLSDPANGGDPKELNLASYKNDNCVGSCSFTREFRSVAADPVTYSASLSDVVGTVTPSSFTVNPGQSVNLTVDIDGSALPAGAVSFGELVLTPQAESQNFDLGAPIAITDNGYQTNDPAANLTCSTINVSGVSPTSTMSVEMAIDHTWAGDVTLKVFNPNNDELAMLNRPGVPAGGFGNSSDLVATAPVTFSDTGTTDAETMGDAGSTICEVDGFCDYFPNPSEEVSSLADFASLVAAFDPNGTWFLCGGDSAGGDPGTIQAASLIFSGEAPSQPELHLPLVVTGFPEQPDIAVAPASLSASLDADTTTDLNLNISNSDVAGADLNWTIATTGSADVTVFDQPTNGTGGIVSDFFNDGVTNAGAYSADSFVLTEGASIDTARFDGFLSNGAPDITAELAAMTLSIYGDNAGVPDGHPEDGAGSELFTITIPINDANLDIGDGTGAVVFDILGANGSALELPAGTYWVTAFGDFTGANRWNWFQGEDITPGNAQLIDPTDIFGAGFTDWTDLTGIDPIFTSLSFGFFSSIDCGAPWLSVNPSSGAIAPGSDEDLTVTLDATGLAPGVYTAAVCVDSDDPDEPQVVVPVSMTVTGLPDLIFANGFE